MGIKIGQRLQEERKRLKLNQSLFGEEVGVLQKTQSHYEKGSRKPDVEYLKAAAAIGVDVQYVVTGCRSSDMYAADGAFVIGEESAKYSGGDVVSEEGKLLKLFRSAPPEIRKAAMRVLGDD